MTATQLKSFLRLRLERIAVDPDTTYNIVGVRSFGGGLFTREPLSGSDTSYKHFNRLSAGQVVLSRLKGWEGAVSLVPDQFDGFYVSTEFPTFDVDTAAADPTFVSYLCKWPGFWELLWKAAQGVGARRTRVKEDQFLEVSIPMPSLGEQQGIGARVRRIDIEAKAALACAETARDHTVALIESLVHRLDLSDVERVRRGWRRLHLDEVLSLDIDAVPVEDDLSYPMVGVYSFGRGLFNKDPVVGRETSYQKFHRLRTNQIVLSRLFAWEGAIAMVEPEHAGRFASTEFPTFTVNESLTTPGFLQTHLGTELFWGGLRSEAAGVGVRRQRVSAERFLAREVWLPPLDVQAATAAHLSELKRLAQDSSRRETLEALVPSAINDTFSTLA